MTRQTFMPDREEATELQWYIFAAAAAVVLGGTVAAAHVDHLKAVMIVSSVVSLIGGLYSVHRAVKLLRPPSAAVVTKAEPAQERDAELEPEALLQDSDTSLMEIRLIGSLKSIREQAEQGLVASDAEKARHLAMIWSMAACDLDDDIDQIAH
jgi:hypothetical protein